MTTYPAEYILFAKTCEYCRGSGQISIGSASNPTPSPGYSNSPGPAEKCPSCSNGLHFIRYDPGAFISMVSNEVINSLMGINRARWYDAVHQEIEKRIKDVEVQMMSAEAMKRASQDLDMLDPTFLVGGRVRFMGNTTSYTVGLSPFTIHPGDVGVVSEVRPFTSSDGSSGVNVFVLFHNQQQGRGVPLPPAILEKVP